MVTGISSLRSGAIYRAASPQGETIFHSDYNERKERGAGGEDGGDNTTGCVLSL